MPLNDGFVLFDGELTAANVSSGGSVLITKVRVSLLPTPLPIELFSSATAV